jgi:hypothetical protein
MLTAKKSGNREVAVIFDNYAVRPFSNADKEDTLSERQYREHEDRPLPLHDKADTSRRGRYELAVAGEDGLYIPAVEAVVLGKRPTNTIVAIQANSSSSDQRDTIWQLSFGLVRT